MAKQANDRRRQAHDRLGTWVVSSVWGALTLLAAGTALLQAADPLPVELPAQTLPPPLHLAAASPASAGWVGVAPNAPDTLEPAPPSF